MNRQRSKPSLRWPQRGFIFGIYGYLAIGLVVVALFAWGNVQSARLSSEQEAHAVTKGQFQVFQAGVKAAGEAQEAKNRETAAKQEKINGERLRALQGRYADIAAKYDRLRGTAANPGSGSLPAVPDPSRPADDNARDKRLLSVLEHAEKQTGQLIELQEWVRQQPR